MEKVFFTLSEKKIHEGGVVEGRGRGADKDEKLWKYYKAEGLVVGRLTQKKENKVYVSP